MKILPEVGFGPDSMLLASTVDPDLDPRAF